MHSEGDEGDEPPAPTVPENQPIDELWPGDLHQLVAGMDDDEDAGLWPDGGETDELIAGIGML